MNRTIPLAVLLTLAVAAFAASPPGRINYQGVLRDAGDKPLDGAFAVTFRFYDDPTMGTLLWEEIYDAVVYPPELTIANGLFSVSLGDPAHQNAGSEASFTDVFQNHPEVHMAVRVESDAEMTPRIQVISAPFALNAQRLEGLAPGQFLRSDTADTAVGPITIGSDTVLADGSLDLGAGPSRSTQHVWATVKSASA